LCASGGGKPAQLCSGMLRYRLQHLLLLLQLTMNKVRSCVNK
jgi:hypothetical protein